MSQIKLSLRADPFCVCSIICFRPYPHAWTHSLPVDLRGHALTPDCILMMASGVCGLCFDPPGSTKSTTDRYVCFSWCVSYFKRRHNMKARSQMCRRLLFLQWLNNTGNIFLSFETTEIVLWNKCFSICIFHWTIFGLTLKGKYLFWFLAKLKCDA